jgi:hypothetical protein
MDIDEERLKVVGSFAQRMVEAKGSPFKVILSTNQRESIQDADYVTTQLRVGHMEARRRDEYLGLRHGLIGQETTGVGGMGKALRTIPVILKIAQDIEVAKPGHSWSISRSGRSRYPGAEQICSDIAAVAYAMCLLRQKCTSSKASNRQPARRSTQARRS